MKNFKIYNQKWKSYSVDSINFILSESKDYLDYTIKESDKITNRAYSIVLLLSAILTGLVGYTFSEVLNRNLSKIFFLNFYLSLVITVFLIILGRIIFPRNIMSKGRIPKDLFKEDFLVNPKLTERENYLSFLIQEIKNTQQKIDFNLNINEKRRNQLKLILFSIFGLFPIYLIIAFYIAI